jgi:N-acetylmuramoyl-L-alanine amidase-like protein
LRRLVRVELTRRGVLQRAAAASSALVGGSLLAPRLVFAGDSGDAVFEMRLPARRGPIETSRPFELLGVRYSGGDAAVEIRARGLDGRWTDWLEAQSAHFHSADATESRARTAATSTSTLTDPVWTGPAQAFEIRARRPLRDARVVLVDSGRHATAAAAKRYVTANLPAGPGQPRIIARSSWATASCRPRRAAGLGAIELAFVHHTVNSNAYGPSQSAGMIRAICLFHKYGNGWADIGYNFVVDRYGQIFEARAGGVDEAIVGAHAGGYNAFSTGVALLGTFSGAGPSRKTFDALAHLVAWKLALHGVAIPGSVTVEVSRQGAPYSRYRAGAQVRLNRISGHRDADTTTCPGAGMYRQLPRLRQAVRRLAPAVGALTLVNQGAAPGTITVSGTLAESGVAIAGATIEVQRRSTTRGAATLAAATTDQDGAWAVALPLVQNAELRALYRGDREHRAVVSAGVLAVVPPQITLTAAGAQAPPGGAIDFTGSVTPAKAKLALVVAQQQLDGTFAPIRTIGLRPDRNGAFARSIGFASAGQYQVVAQTQADNANGPGASAPVTITIA